MLRRIVGWVCLEDDSWEMLGRKMKSRMESAMHVAFLQDQLINKWPSRHTTSLCRKNFNFLFKMNGMWAELAKPHLPLQEKAEPTELQLIK